MQKSSKPKSNSQTPKKEQEEEKKEEFDGISSIGNKNNLEDMNLEDEDDDEMIDDLAKFVEAQDVELVKDHSN